MEIVTKDKKKIHCVMEEENTSTTMEVITLVIGLEVKWKDREN